MVIAFGIGLIVAVVIGSIPVILEALDAIASAKLEASIPPSDRLELEDRFQMIEAEFAEREPDNLI